MPSQAVDSEESFREHIQGSGLPVVIRFTADWCGPCKQLQPVLEKSAERFNGEDGEEKIRMLSVDIDQEFGRMLAGHFQVQSVPAVFSVINGQVLNTFTGAQPPHAVDQFLDEVVDQADAQGLYANVKESDSGEQQNNDPWTLTTNGEKLYEEGKYEEALELFGKVVQNEDAKNIHPKAMIGMTRTFIKLEKIEEAKQILEQLPPEDYHSPEVKKLRGTVDLMLNPVSEGDLSKAAQLSSAGQHSEAIDILLELLSKDSQDQEAKTLLLQVFESAGEEDPATQEGRRRLATLMF